MAFPNDCDRLLVSTTTRSAAECLSWSRRPWTTRTRHSRN